MTPAGVRLFTALSGIFGAVWGLLTTGTPSGVVVGASAALVVGYLCWKSMEMPRWPRDD